MKNSEMHEFNADFISRYAKRLSREDLRMVWNREFTATETGVAFFQLDKEYVSDDGKETIKYLGMLDEAYSLIEYLGEEVEVEMSSINYLATLALERAGLPMPAYNQFLLDMMEHIPAINSRGYYSISEGKYKYLADAEGEEAEWINKYEMLQYNNMFDKKNKSKIFFPYLN